MSCEYNCPNCNCRFLLLEQGMDKGRRNSEYVKCPMCIEAMKNEEYGVEKNFNRGWDYGKDNKEKI